MFNMNEKRYNFVYQHLNLLYKEYKKRFIIIDKDGKVCGAYNKRREILRFNITEFCIYDLFEYLNINDIN